MSDILPIKDRTAIVGIGETKFAKRLEPSEIELACMAIKSALDDAGIHPSEVNALSSYTMESSEEVEIARNLGLGDITFFSQIHYGGGAGCGCILHWPWPWPPARPTWAWPGVHASGAPAPGPGRRSGRGCTTTGSTPVPTGWCARPTRSRC